MPRRRVTAAVACLVLLPACDAGDLVAHRLPACDPTGDPTTHLMAQAVPEAVLLPCVEREELPASWWLSDLEIDSHGSAFTLTAGRYGPGGPGIDVEFTSDCDVADAVQVPTDERGTERFAGSGGPGGFTTEWRYRFPGGCVTYRVRPPDDVWDRFVVDVQRTVEFVDRAEVIRRHDAVLGR